MDQISKHLSQIVLALVFLSSHIALVTSATIPPSTTASPSNTTESRIASLAVYSCMGGYPTSGQIMESVTSPTVDPLITLANFKNYLYNIVDLTRTALSKYTSWISIFAVSTQQSLQQSVAGVFNIQQTQHGNLSNETNYGLYVMTQLSIHAYYLSTQENDGDYGTGRQDMTSIKQELVKAICLRKQLLQATLTNAQMTSYVTADAKPVDSLQQTKAALKRAVTYTAFKLMLDTYTHLKEYTN